MKDKIAYLIEGLGTLSLGGKVFKGGELSFRSMAVVGSSCAGKTTLINEIRNSLFCKSGKVTVPVRYITRAKRENDDPDENVYISSEEFIKKVENLKIGLYWKKRMDPVREEMFGFDSFPAGTILIYSGNNGLLYSKDSIHPRGIMNTMLLVGVYAPDEVRKKRLLMRSPDLVQDKSGELQYRLADSSEKLFNQVHIIINNYGPQMNNARQDIVDLVNRMLINNAIDGH